MKQLISCNRRYFTNLILTLIFLLSAQRSFSQTAEVVTNQTVIKLQKAGISNDIISAKINNSPCSFDLSVDGIIALKKDSVTDDIIKVMITRGSTVAPPQSPANPVVAAPVVSAPVNNMLVTPVQNNKPAQKDTRAAELALAPGLYYFNPTTNEYTELETAALTKNAENVTGKVTGFFNGKIKASIPGRESNTVVDAGKPLFVLVFDTENRNARTAAPNPSDYLLVQFEPTGSDREINLRKSSADGFDRGVDNTAKLQFHYKRIQKGLFEITPSSPMPTGEFCFMAPAASPDQLDAYKVFDFSIQ
jgi:hypothetical protein